MTKPINCFKAYDARGKVPDDLNAEIAYRVGRAYAEFIQPKTGCCWTRRAPDQ